MIARAREKPSPSLLRTLLAVFNHLEAVNALYGYLELAARTLNNAGFDVTLDMVREISWAKVADSFKTPSKQGLSPTDQLLEVFMKPLDGQATLTLPTVNGAQSEKLVIATRTIIGQPTFGTEHKLTLPSPLTSDLGLFQQLKFSAVDEVRSYLDWILSMHIAHRLLKSEHSSEAVVRSHDPRVTLVSKGNKKGATTARDITVKFEEGRLCLTAVAVDLQQESSGTEQRHTWDGQQSATTLQETIKNWLS